MGAFCMSSSCRRLDATLRSVNTRLVLRARPSYPPRSIVTLDMRVPVVPSPRTLMQCLLLWLLLGPPLLAWAATGDAGAGDPQPLHPPTTPSPRDTLRGFLGAVDQLVVNKRESGAFDEDSYRMLRRAADLLDFSATPHGDNWAERILRVALLHEVLGRVALPPEAEVPDVQAAADGMLTDWQIPGTSIHIERVEAGPRAGEFLFSAATVAAADRIYRRAKDLPYRDDATPGVYEQVVALAVSDGVYTSQTKLQQRLQPVDTDSPRATLNGFLESINQAYALVMRANRALSARPPRMSRAQAREVEAQAARLLERATAALDFATPSPRCAICLTARRPSRGPSSIIPPRRCPRGSTTTSSPPPGTWCRARACRAS